MMAILTQLGAGINQTFNAKTRPPRQMKSLLLFSFHPHWSDQYLTIGTLVA